MTINITPQLRHTGAAYVGYANFLETLAPTITAESEEAGFAKENAATWASYEKWQSVTVGTSWWRASFASPVQVDCFGVYKHNFGDASVTLTCQYSTNGGSSWNTLEAVTPGDNETIFHVEIGGAVTAQDWRFQTSGATAAALVGVFFLGKATLLLDLETGFTPPKLWPVDEFLNQQSEGGEFLGRSLLRRGSKSRLELTRALQPWLETNWEPFIEAAKAHPWFFGWDLQSHPDETYFCYTDKRFRPGSLGPVNYGNVSLEFLAL